MFYLKMFYLKMFQLKILTISRMFWNEEGENVLWFFSQSNVVELDCDSSFYSLGDVPMFVCLFVCMFVCCLDDVWMFQLKLKKRKVGARMSLTLTHQETKNDFEIVFFLYFNLAKNVVQIFSSLINPIVNGI